MMSALRALLLLKPGREATEKDGASTGAHFPRKAGGRDIFPILPRYQDESGFRGSGCRSRFRP